MPDRARARAALTAVLAPLLALLATACGPSEATRERQAPPPASRPVPVSTAAVEERHLPRVLEVSGALAADAQADIAAETAGRVVEVLVERGKVVEAGAVLARLDSEEALLQLREAEAVEAQLRARLGLTDDQRFDPADTPEVRRARVAMERAEADYRRYERLVEQGLVSRSEYDVRRAEALAAREQHAEALNQARQLYQALLAQRTRVAAARKALNDTTIRAPWLGLIAERHATVGQFLARGGRVATLVRVDPLRVELIIPEVAVAAVKPGQKVSFTVQTYPDRRFDATIAYVGPALRADARALVVEALVPNASRLLRPGLFAIARIELPATQSSLMVPAAAVRRQAGVARVYVVRDGRAQERIVQVGRAAEALVEVVRGVSAGERVVVGGLDGVVDGVPVAESGPGTK